MALSNSPLPLYISGAKNKKKERKITTICHHKRKKKSDLISIKISAVTV